MNPNEKTKEELAREYAEKDVKFNLEVYENTPEWANKRDLYMRIVSAHRAGHSAAQAKAEAVIREMEKALQMIAKNNTDERELYTEGCDCDEVATKALAKLKSYRGEK